MKSASSTEKRYRRASVYRRAAKRMEEMDLSQPNGHLFKYGYACNAIQSVQGRDVLAADTPATKAFKETFSPGWANEFGFFGRMERQQNRDRRIIALCFMAAMTERP